MEDRTETTSGGQPDEDGQVKPTARREIFAKCEDCAREEQSRHAEQTLRKRRTEETARNAIWKNMNRRNTNKKTAEGIDTERVGKVGAKSIE